MFWYKIATVLEDIPVNPEPYTNIETAIEVLHELELKNHFIDTMPELSVVNPRRKENIQNRLKPLAWKYFEVCKDQIESIFERWKEGHRIHSAEEFSDMVIEELREEISLDNEKIIEHVTRYGLSRGSIKIDPKTLMKHVNPERIKAIIREDFYNEKSVYEYQIKDYLNDKYPEWEEEGKDCIEYMEEHGLESEVEEYIVEVISQDPEPEVYGFTIEDLRLAIEKELYPSYMANFGGSVKSVHETIDEAVNRMNEISEDDSISQMTAAISLALNVLHVFGNIMQDYGGIEESFLDMLDQRFSGKPEWKQEVVEQFFGKKPI